MTQEEIESVTCSLSLFKFSVAVKKPRRTTNSLQLLQEKQQCLNKQENKYSLKNGRSNTFYEPKTNYEHERSQDSTDYQKIINQGFSSSFNSSSDEPILQKTLNNYVLKKMVPNQRQIKGYHNRQTRSYFQQYQPDTQAFFKKNRVFLQCKRAEQKHFCNKNINKIDRAQLQKCKSSLKPNKKLESQKIPVKIKKQIMFIDAKPSSIHSFSNSDFNVCQNLQNSRHDKSSENIVKYRNLSGLQWGASNKQIKKKRLDQSSSTALLPRNVKNNGLKQQKIGRISWQIDAKKQNKSNLQQNNENSCSQHSKQLSSLFIQDSLFTVKSKFKTLADVGTSKMLVSSGGDKTSSNHISLVGNESQSGSITKINALTKCLKMMTLKNVPMNERIWDEWNHQLHI